jgi:hypothetical protein
VVEQLVASDETSICLSVRDTLPSYMIDGYEVILLKHSDIVEKIKIPTLKPGEKWHFKVSNQVDQVQLVRPNGFLIKEIKIK